MFIGQANERVSLALAWMLLDGFHSRSFVFPVFEHRCPSADILSEINCDQVADADVGDVEEWKRRSKKCCCCQETRSKVKFNFRFRA